MAAANNYMPAQAPTAEPAPWWRVVLIGRRPKRTLARLVVLATLCVLVRVFVILPILVEGISMLPTYQDGSRHFINRLAYLFREPQRGDVVAIRFAGEHVMLLKRVVGLPGESVAFHKGRLLINGQVMDEPYLRPPCNWEVPPEQVEPDRFYVVGDNRTMPAADHVKGKAERKRILGRLLL